MRKRFLLLAGLLCLVLDTPAALAQEPPELDLIRGLRKRGWNDLALERLRQLQARTQPPLPEEWKQVLPLEIAKTQAAMAAKVEDAAERDRLIDSTRKDLDAFVKNPAHAKSPALGEAYFDLARLTTEQANAKYAGARHAADAAQRNAEIKDAIALFTTAEAAFKEATKRLEDRHLKVRDSKNTAERHAALELYLDALFQHGMTMWQLSEVYPKDEAKGAEALKASSKAFDTLAGFRDKPEDGAAAVALGWQAYAWYGRTMMELETAKGALAYQRIEQQRKPDAAVAQRLVRYFKLASNYAPGATAAVRNPVVLEAEKWLKDYPAAVNSAEGQHIRYLLGLMYVDDLEEEKNPQRKSTPAYQALVTKTTNHLTELEKQSSRYGAVAANLKLRTRYVSGQAISSPIAQLKTFEDCLLRADHELREAQQAQAKVTGTIGGGDQGNEEAKKEVQSRYRNMLEAMRRGIGMIPDTVKEDQWEKAYTYLYLGYLNTDDYQRAVIALDHLARHTKKPEDAETRIGTTLNLYLAIASENGDAYARQQVVALAAIMEQRWPNGKNTEKAREILGFDLLKHKQLREAATMLGKVTEKHPNFGHCSFWAGRIFWSLHFQAMREAKKTVQTPSSDRDQAVALLTRCIKSLAANQAAGSAKLAVDAKVGLAEIHNQLGQTDEVLKLLGPLVTEAEQNKLPQELEKGTDTQILGLALRAHIQKKDIAGAIKVLDILQKQGSQEDIGKGLKDHLVSLGMQIKSEIDNLSTQGEPAAERLAQTKESFRQFLGHLEKDPKLTTELRIWVGTNYAGLGDFLKATEIFHKLNEATPAGHAQCNLSALLLYHAALRQAAAAEKEKPKREDLFRRAELELAKSVAAADKIKKHPAFIKEQVHLKQERGQLSGATGAIVAWDKLRTHLEPYIQNNAQWKAIYLEATYNVTYCLYLEARQIQDPSVRKDALERAAAKLKSFQQIDELKPRFADLLSNPQHGDLKKAYEELGRAAAK